VGDDARSVALWCRNRQTGGCRGIELDASPGGRIFLKNGETAFRLQARGLEDNGPASLRVELDAGGSAFRPGSQPMKRGHGRSAVL